MKNIGMNFSQHKKFFNKYLICKKKRRENYIIFSFSFLIVRKSKHSTIVKMYEGKIRFLRLKAREIFLSQSNLLELEAPIKVCGW